MSYNNKKREQKSELARQKIYASAEKLFIQHGPHAVSVDAIVRDANVAKGSFYLHFESKDQLIALMIRDHVMRRDEEYRQFLHSLPTEADTATTLLDLVEHIIDILMNTIGLQNMSLIYKFSLGKTLDTNSVLDYQRDIYRIFYDLITRGISRGEFHTTQSAEMLAKHCVLLLRATTFEWCIRDKDYNYLEETLEHFKVFIEGIQ